MKRRPRHLVGSHTFLLTRIRSWTSFILTTFVQATRRPNAHGNNLFDIKGLSIILLNFVFICVRCFPAKLILRVKQKLTSHFQFSINVLKFENQVSFLILLKNAQFSCQITYYTFESINTEINRQEKISSSLRPLIIPMISLN